MAIITAKETYVYEEGYKAEKGPYYKITIIFRDGNQHIRTFFYKNLKTEEIRRSVKA